MTLVDGQRQEIPVPEDKVAVVEEQYEALMESVAETSEEFMEKFFSGEELQLCRDHAGPAQGRQGLAPWSPSSAAAP